MFLYMSLLNWEGKFTNEETMHKLKMNSDGNDMQFSFLTQTLTPSLMLPTQICFENAVTLKNCRVWEVLLYLKAKELACYSFMNSGRKHETSVSETKHLLFPSEQAAWTSWVIQCPCPPGLMVGRYRRVWVDAMFVVGLHHSWGTPCLMNPSIL